ncbi:MAG: type II toxin-antitoxin system VapC family toxin [Bacteroidota bacterium]
MSRILIDTNVFVYRIDEDSTYYSRAKRLLDQREKELTTTSKNILEFLTVVTKPSGYNLDTRLALEIAREIIQNVDIIYPTQESMEILFELTHQYSPSGLKIHDFEIISIGLAHGIDEVATFNTKDFDAVKEIALLQL